MVLAWHSSPVDSSLLMQRQTIDLTPRLFQWSLRPVVGVHLFPDCIKSGRCSPAPSVLLRFHAVHCSGREVVPNLILIVEVTFIVTIHTHSIDHQQIESDDFTFAISYNLRVGISIKEKMRHQSLSEDKGRHFWIWLIVNQSIQRMLDCLFFTTGVSILINMDRQSCNGIRKNSDTGVDCSHLHGTSFIDGFARVASAKEKTIGAVIGTVGGLVSGAKQS